MLSRRALLSRDIPNIVTIPLLGSFTASNGAEPSVNSGCSLTSSGLYTPSGGFVIYNFSDLYPKKFTKLVLEMDLTYTKSRFGHGWFDFFDKRQTNLAPLGVNYNTNPRGVFYLYDIVTIEAFSSAHVKVVADFSNDLIAPHGEIGGYTVRKYNQGYVEKPSAITLGYNCPSDKGNGWEGYCKNVKITFD